MTEVCELEALLAAARVDDAVSDICPDYRVLLLAADGITPADSDDVSEQLLRRAESVAGDLLAKTAVEEVPHVAAWRDAYRAFGSKPQRTRNSLEALLRRAAAGLPRVNRLTDVYNALSVIHQVPLGGENLGAYFGAPRLVRATGDETFDQAGDGVVEHPEPGEVVWCDDVGVTCRRWNWRQCRRTQLAADTTSALFIVDGLAPISDEALIASGDDLADCLRGLGPTVRVATRVIHPGTPS